MKKEKTPEFEKQIKELLNDNSCSVKGPFNGGRIFNEIGINVSYDIQLPLHGDYLYLLYN